MKKKIILIEDDQDSGTLLKHVLSSAGFEVAHYFSSNHILDNALTNPDLFILDISLPNIDGAALTKYLKIKATTTETPVLIMSGNPSVSNKTRKAGASAFVVKPFEVSLFLNVVQKLMSDRDFTYFPSAIKEDAHR